MENWQETICLRLKKRSLIQSLPYKSLISSCNFYTVETLLESHTDAKSKNQQLEREIVINRKSSG